MAHHFCGHLADVLEVQLDGPSSGHLDLSRVELHRVVRGEVDGRHRAVIDDDLNLGCGLSLDRRCGRRLRSRPPSCGAAASAALGRRASTRWWGGKQRHEVTSELVLSVLAITPDGLSGGVRCGHRVPRFMAPATKPGGRRLSAWRAW